MLKARTTSAPGKYLAVVRPIGLLRLCGNRAIPCSNSVADVNEELASERASVALPEFRIGALRHSEEHDITKRYCLVHGAYPCQGPKPFDEALSLFGVTR